MKHTTCRIYSKRLPSLVHLSYVVKKSWSLWILLNRWHSFSKLAVFKSDRSLCMLKVRDRQLQDRVTTGLAHMCSKSGASILCDTKVMAFWKFLHTDNFCPFLRQSEKIMLPHLVHFCHATKNIHSVLRCQHDPPFPRIQCWPTIVTGSVQNTALIQERGRMGDLETTSFVQTLFIQKRR